MIEADALSKSYGSFQALRGVSFAARPGRMTRLLGHDGAGKTTCIRVLTGYLTPSAGSASVAGCDVLAAPLAARAATGYLPESAPSYPEMRVDDYLRYRAALCRVPARGRRAAVDRAAERCWLREVRRQRIGSLSKGFRQRVGLAAALVADPKALILDEPASGLDPAQIVEMRTLIRELAQDRVVLLSSHILSDIEATCDDAVILARGKVRAAGALADLGAGTASQKLTVECQADRTAAGALLRAAGFDPQHATLRTDAGWTHAEIASSDDARERVAAAASSAGITVRELTSSAPSLERVLLELLEPPAEDRR